MARPQWANRLARTLTPMATIGKAAKRRQADADRERQRALRREQEALRLEEERVAEITRLIETTGWAVCVADSDDPMDPAPHFGYTIGRSAKGQPELCAWGHSREDIQSTLNLIGALLERDQHLIEVGDAVTLPGVGAWRALPVPAPVLHHLEYARKRYTFLRAVRMMRVI